MPLPMPRDAPVTAGMVNVRSADYARVLPMATLPSSRIEDRDDIGAMVLRV